MKLTLKIVLTLLVVSMLAITLFAVGCVNDTEDTKTEPKTEDKKEEDKEIEGVVGEPVRVGDAEWTVLEAKKPAPVEEDSAPPNGEFLAVKVEVRNFSKDKQTVGEVYPLKVVDSENKETGETNLFVSMPADWGEPIDKQELEGGEEATGYAVFDVKTDEEGFKLKVRGWAIVEQQIGYIDLDV